MSRPRPVRLFFLWVYLKSKVYSTKPDSKDVLLKNIKREIKLDDTGMCAKVIDNFEICVKKAKFNEN